MSTWRKYFIKFRRYDMYKSVTLRHKGNKEILNEVCHDVRSEPTLASITSLRLSNVSDVAKVDISAHGFWIRGQRALFLIEVFPSFAPSNRHEPTGNSSSAWIREAEHTMTEFSRGWVLSMFLLWVCRVSRLAMYVIFRCWKRMSLRTLPTVISFWLKFHIKSTDTGLYANNRCFPSDNYNKSVVKSFYQVQLGFQPNGNSWTLKKKQVMANNSYTQTLVENIVRNSNEK